MKINKFFAMIKNLVNLLEEWLKETGLTAESTEIIKVIIIIAVVATLAFIADWVTKKILVESIKKVVRKSKSRWDDVLVKRKVLQRLSHLAPAIIIYYSAKLGLSEFETLSDIVLSVVNIYMILVVLLTLDALINSFHDIYLTLPIANERPIKGYLQVGKILIHSVGGILILSILIGKSPTAILASLGALAAVLILVFRDTILGFVSSIQLSANKMVKPGDWISMPGRNADGIVSDITVNTVKVRNWDKTISTIPTYALINESFQNWKGMEQSKGRRIARAINIDIKSIKFCDDEMLNKFKRIKLIRDYINQKQEEIEQFNKEQGITNEDTVSRRRLTNIGIFRQYIEIYLEKNPKIQPNKPPFIIMVRHLQPTDKGLPIQIYAFSKEQKWAIYEKVQADIFDHILAVIPEFELRVFQNPSGDDFRSLQSIHEN
jgi:miniconductance mechanosensitive channel